MWGLFVVYVGVSMATAPVQISAFSVGAQCETAAAKFNADIKRAGSFNAVPLAVCILK